MKVKKEMKLIDFLSLSYNRKNVKNLLKYKEVYVNGKQVSQFDYLLKEDDFVEIKKENNSPLEILYEDQDFVVINKPSGLLSMSDGKEKEKTAYHYVSEYLKKQNKNQAENPELHFSSGSVMVSCRAGRCSPCRLLPWYLEIRWRELCPCSVSAWELFH